MEHLVVAFDEAEYREEMEVVGRALMAYEGSVLVVEKVVELLAERGNIEDSLVASAYLKNNKIWKLRNSISH